ncbi:MAG: NAD(P)-dependent oxidoreductase [Acholeplasmatales bacterium]|nr:NAD(P)-dependent oxidoreductase [Acholeplasmatales bacterium]
MKIIVTGANGFIGKSLIKKLIKNNIEVFAIDLKFDDELNNKLVTKIDVSLDDYDLLLSKLKGSEYDLMYHFAWIGVNGPDKGNAKKQLKNIDMTLNCARLCKELNIKKLLCSGTVSENNIKSINDENKNYASMIYGKAKSDAHNLLESYCKTNNIDFVWMQFSNIYGPSNKTGNLISYTLNQLNNNMEATFGPALQPYDFIYVDDLIDIIYLLGVNKTNKNFYFIGSGSPMILKDYLLEIGKLLNKEELIKIGVRNDDGIKYDYKMFDTSDLKEIIKDYKMTDFISGIKKC